MATLVLFRAHGLLHWQIIRDHRAQFEGQLKEDLFRLLSHLEIYHLTALFTVIFAVWSFQGQPRWIRWVCVPMLVTSGLLCLVIM